MNVETAQCVCVRRIRNFANSVLNERGKHFSEINVIIIIILILQQLRCVCTRVHLYNISYHEKRIHILNEENMQFLCLAYFAFRLYDCN